MLEVLWLLLPVAAASGWWIGRRGADAAGKPQFRLKHSPDYFKGLNYLLNEKQDEALEVFLRMAEVDSEIVETHLALGNLFRRRGEVDRAIRIHQNLIARPNLGKVERAQALLELARDYMKAGLLDRSEKLFRELLETDLETEEALLNLSDIYERENEWDKAIGVAKRLERKRGNTSGELLAHYHCEQGEVALSAGDLRGAHAAARKAIDADPNCSRAAILDATIATMQHKYKHAVRAYRSIEQHDPELLPEVIDALLDAMLSDGNRAALLGYIEDLKARRNGYPVVHAAAGMVRKLEGDEAAQAFFRSQLQMQPSLRGLRELVALEHDSDPGNQKSAVWLELLNRVVDSKPAYHCKQCGFRGQMLHWQCPGCRTWNSIKPIVDAEGE